jgi:putative endonuclease
VSSFTIGRRAESVAAEYLRQQGYQILDQNWRTRYCEIDIVSLKSGVVYFVEVKYRVNHHYGSGLDSITTTKLRQMHFAAEFWVNNNDWRGSYELLVLAITGKNLTKAKLVVI